MIYIRPVKLAALDLNLLVALDALLAEASVSRAAARIGLSQPAASHALRRLRELFGDPLLVRTGRSMELTPRAESLREPLRQALDRVEHLFGAPGFDPAVSKRRFRVMMPDLVTSVLMPRLVERVASEAPTIVLEVVGWRGPEVMTAEFARSLDMIVSWTRDAFPGFHRQGLYADRDTLAVRAAHPEADRLSSLDGFLAAKHIAVVGGGESSDPIDQWLATLGLERRVALVVPTYLQALQVAAITDLVAFAPGRMITALAPHFGLIECAPPIDPGEDVQFLLYPARAAKDPGSVWLRAQVAKVVAEM